MDDHLPDSSILIDALNGKQGRKELLRSLAMQGHELACCAVTVAEVYAGMRPHEAAVTQSFLTSLAWYDIPAQVARLAGELRFQWARRGHTVSLTDTLIAATALHYGLVLITDNRKHFPMPELRLYPLPKPVR